MCRKCKADYGIINLHVNGNETGVRVCETYNESNDANSTDKLGNCEAVLSEHLNQLT